MFLINIRDIFGSKPIFGSYHHGRLIMTDKTTNTLIHQKNEENPIF